MSDMKATLKRFAYGRKIGLVVQPNNSGDATLLLELAQACASGRAIFVFGPKTILLDDEMIGILPPAFFIDAETSDA